MTQWVLRCEDGFIVYHFGAGVSKVFSIENATIFTPALWEAWGDSILNLAKERGYEDLEWTTVKIEESEITKISIKGVQNLKFEVYDWVKFFEEFNGAPASAITVARLIRNFLLRLKWDYSSVRPVGDRVIFKTKWGPVYISTMDNKLVVEYSEKFNDIVNDIEDKVKIITDTIKTSISILTPVNDVDIATYEIPEIKMLNLESLKKVKK